MNLACFGYNHDHPGLPSLPAWVLRVVCIARVDWSCAFPFDQSDTPANERLRLRRVRDPLRQAHIGEPSRHDPTVRDEIFQC